MDKIIDKLPWLNNLQTPLIGIFSMVAAYFDSTITFIYALMSAFVFNILAGMRADDVSLKKLGNFSLLKFKDSLIELMVICSVTYLLKGIMDLMKLDEKSTYAVQILIWVALYFYFRNGVRNLSKAYPKIIWLRVLYHLISFQFTKAMPESVSKSVDKALEDVEEHKKKELENKPLESTDDKNTITIHGSNSGIVGNSGTIGNIGCNNINTEKDATSK